MKIFLDTANLAAIRKFAQMGIIDGVTTNPSHLSKEKNDPTQQILDICNILPEGIISVEITQDEPEKVYNQALDIHHLAKNIAVKIPCHEQYYPIIKKLVLQDIPINITLVFSLTQSLMMCKLGVAYISPFIGRLDDIDNDGISLLQDIQHMINMYQFNTKVIAASIRNGRHLHETIMTNVAIATIPIEVCEKALIHPLTEKGIQLFKKDWQTLNVKQFPSKG